MKTTLKTVKQALYCNALLAGIVPISAIAGVKIDSVAGVADTTLALKVATMILVSLAGGISSTFIQTSFDESIKKPNIAKIFIGTALGALSGLMLFDNFDVGIFTLLLPTYVIASLGAPIMVFYLMWVSQPENQAELIEAIKNVARRKRGN